MLAEGDKITVARFNCKTGNTDVWQAKVTSCTSKHARYRRIGIGTDRHTFEDHSEYKAYFRGRVLLSKQGVTWAPGWKGPDVKALISAVSLL